MKIAALGARSVPAKHGGLEVVVEALSEELAKSHDVTVFVSEGSEVGRAKITTTRSFKGKYTHTASQLLTSYFRAARSGFDVLHIHGVGPSFVLLLDWKRSTPVFVTAHGVDWDRAKWPPLARRLFRSVAIAALRRATAVSAVSGSTAERISELTGRQVSVIENAVDLPFEVDVSGYSLPERFSLVLSRLTPEKGIELVLKAYTAEVAAAMGPLVIAGGGSGSYSDSYERHLRETAPDGVRWLGQVDRAHAISVLRSASTVISASLLEAQPMSIIEAHALGIQLFLSDIPAHREVAGADAIYFQPNDSESLRAALLEGRRARDSRPGPSRWTNRSWKQVAGEYEQFYERHIIDK